MSCTKLEPLQLLRHANLASRIILSKRLFVAYLLTLASSVKQLHYYVHLNKMCRDDLLKLVLFLKNKLPGMVCLCFMSEILLLRMISICTLMQLPLRDSLYSMDLS